MCQEVRLETIRALRQAAVEVDRQGRQASLVECAGAGGGALASSLTIVGGVLSVATGAGLLPLMAGAGLGLLSGLAGGSAAVSRRLAISRQLALVDTALQVDASATADLAAEVRSSGRGVRGAAGAVVALGGLAASARGLLDLAWGIQPGAAVLSGLQAVGGAVGQGVSPELGQLLVRASSGLLAGTVTSVCGGATLVWDLWQLRTGVRQLAAGGEEGARQIEDIAQQLEEGLEKFFQENQSDLKWFNIQLGA